MQAAEFQYCYRLFSEPILLLDVRGTIVAANRAGDELFGLDRHGGPVRTFLEFTPEPDKCIRFLKRCQRSTEMWPGAALLKCGNGSAVSFRMEGALLSPHQTGSDSRQILLRLLTKETTTGRFVVLNERIEALNKEISERQRAQSALALSNQSLLHANQDLEQFAYSASHDLREPLRMVALYSDLLKRRYQGRLDAAADEYLAQTMLGATRMEALITDLLAYTQALSGFDDPAACVDAGTVLDQALSNLKAGIQESGATIHRGSALPMLYVKEVHLLQLFQNLVGNAVKYRGEQAPFICVTAQQEGAGQWRVSVHDNGIGIAPQYAEQVFGLFRRLHTADAYPGTGMGLAICQKIVHRYGGRIWVESDGEGWGSTFHFTLPGARSCLHRE